MKIKSAFTLIELLVVIAIIALLLSILMPSFHKTNDPGRLYGESNVVYVDGHVDVVAPVNSFHATWVEKGSWLSDRE